MGGRRVIRASELTPQSLLEMEEDLLYEIVGVPPSGGGRR